MVDKLLIVEDEHETREMLARFISRRGVEVFAAGTGKEAIELFAQHKPTITLLDVKLPDMTGVEVLREIKKIEPSAIAYFVTGTTTADLVFEKNAQELGATGYYSKPINLEDIMKLLESF